MSEIENDLPLYFAYDLEKHIKKYPKSDVLMIIDTFEALNVKESEVVNRRRNERWIQNIIEQFSSDVFPNCLFTIFGREQLGWDKDWMQYVTEKELKNFNQQYAKEYLTTAKIHEPEIVDKIIESSGSYPFYL